MDHRKRRKKHTHTPTQTKYTNVNLFIIKQYMDNVEQADLAKERPQNDDNFTGYISLPCQCTNA